VRWTRAGAAQSLGVLPGGRDSRAFGINDAGDAVGAATAPTGRKHAVRWSGGSLVDLGTLPGDDDSEAFAINSSGDVVGASTGPRGTHAVLWRGGTALDLGTLADGATSRALGINDRGDVVGTSAVGHGLHAFLWTSAEGLQDLNALIPASSFVLMEAVAVNARGAILVIGRDGSDDDAHDHHEEFPVRVFLLEPQP